MKNIEETISFFREQQKNIINLGKFIKKYGNTFTTPHNINITILYLKFEKRFHFADTDNLGNDDPFFHNTVFPVSRDLNLVANSRLMRLYYEQVHLFRTI